ncbi:cytochrome b6-f complex subunit PetL [Gloeothece verrucosa]|uniref:Cytochrome B6-F complex subunit VI n=1 Tax=Gloeothece verrucosa (strain PCC 7822) TaxID=497965 RepID=E0UJX4_GLOV7|nr:cytochrome b6-f complex subunit PetL [Gloeothece verrucosa]ADN13485.1 Cytochrome B6-F complex subunit VI [Gloeothece verrucosa PCC 7822]
MSAFAVGSFIGYLAVFTVIAAGLYLGFRAIKLI